MFACQTWRIDTGMGSACERQQTVSGAIIGLVHLIVSVYMCILGLYSNGHNAACLCCRAVGGVMRMGHGQVAWFMSEWPCKVCLGGWCHGLRQRWLCVGRSMHCLLLGMRKSRVSCACLQQGGDHSLSSFLRGEIQALVSCMFHSHRVAFTVKGGVTYTSS